MCSVYAPATNCLTHRVCHTTTRWATLINNLNFMCIKESYVCVCVAVWHANQKAIDVQCTRYDTLKWSKKKIKIISKLFILSRKKNDLLQFWWQLEVVFYHSWDIRFVDENLRYVFLLGYLNKMGSMCVFALMWYFHG